MARTGDLTPQARAAKVTWLLLKHGELTSQGIMQATGLTNVGVIYMMNNLSLAGIPIWKPAPGYWRLLRDDEDLAPLDRYGDGWNHG